MATQVKPRLIQPKRFTGHQKSADVIRNQPAYSIRARDHASQTEAECMAAIYTCKAGTEKMLGKKGRPCMKRDSSEAVDALCLDGQALEFVKDQYRHCKTILALGGSPKILSKAGIPLILPSGDADPGLLIEGQEGNDANTQSFIAAIGRHRHVERDRDPPLV
jgi:hypothetical protein